MDNFTEAYTKAREVATTQKFSDEWQSFIRDKVGLAKFLARTGLATSQARAPARLREKLANGVKEKQPEGEQLYAAAANPLSAGCLEDRAATLKFVRHMHHAHKRGGQDVWVYAPPKSDAGWVFDEIAGDKATVVARLDRKDEIFSEQERKWMCASLMLSRKISEDCKRKLSGGLLHSISPHTKECVKRWFMDETCGDDELKAALATLLGGFKKIASACNSSTLVFADYPDWRAKRDDYFGAAFRGGEGGGFPVVYLEGAFTRLTGNSGKTWLCAETIIHELSHHEVSTQDHRYDHHGLKPNSAAFGSALALDNADSWGYFALDLAGYLSATDRTKVWK
jgi:hypothetical protein